MSGLFICKITLHYHNSKKTLAIIVYIFRDSKKIRLNVLNNKKIILYKKLTSLKRTSILKSPTNHAAYLGKLESVSLAKQYLNKYIAHLQSRNERINKSKHHAIGHSV